MKTPGNPQWTCVGVLLLTQLSASCIQRPHRHEVLRQRDEMQAKLQLRDHGLEPRPGVDIIGEAEINARENAPGGGAITPPLMVLARINGGGIYFFPGSLRSATVTQR